MLAPWRAQAAMDSASGTGVRRNPALRDILRARFGMPLAVVAHQEEAAYGAAAAAVSMSPKIRRG